MDNQFSKRPIQEKKIRRRYDSWPIGKIIQKPEPEQMPKPKLKHNGKDIKCVTFDFGGVYTYRDIITHVFETYKKEHGVDIVDFWKKVHTTTHWMDFFTGKISEVEFWANSKKELKAPNFDESFFSQRLREASVDIDPRMEMLVARLKSMGYITAMLTNNAREWFDFIKYSGRLKAFDYILTSYDLGVKKPNPLIYEALLGTVGVKAEECVFLDDFKQNAKGARKLGIHDITFKSYEQACEELERILGKRIV